MATDADTRQLLVPILAASGIAFALRLAPKSNTIRFYIYNFPTSCLEKWIEKKSVYMFRLKLEGFC